MIALAEVADALFVLGLFVAVVAYLVCLAVRSIRGGRP